MVHANQGRLPVRARRRQDDESFEINLVPMIDCMLILLIFFMVATTLKHMEKELPLQLPPSTAAVARDAEENLLVLAVDKSGNKYIGGSAVTKDDLLRTLDEAGRKEVKPRIRIDADRDTRYEEVIELVELCQFNSLRDIGLHTRTEPPR